MRSSSSSTCSIMKCVQLPISSRCRQIPASFAIELCLGIFLSNLWGAISLDAQLAKPSMRGYAGVVPKASCSPAIVHSFEKLFVTFSSIDL